jgi:DNA-binding GntR family transcriptional regulator
MVERGDGPGPAGRGGTLGRQVYQELHRRIMGGTLLPGARLTLRGLARDLDVSIQPVREAVGRLAAEAALDLDSGRGIVVPRLDRTTLDEIWSIRVLLEGEAAARFAGRDAAEEIERLIEAHHRRVEAAAVTETPERDFLLQAGGLLISQGCGSPILLGQIMNLRLRSAPHIAEALARPIRMEPGFIRQTLAIQLEVMRAIRSRDAPRALHLRRANLLMFQHYIYRRLGWE